MKLKTLLSVLPIIHAAMVFGLIVFAGFVYWQNPAFAAAMDTDDTFIYLVPIVAAVGYFGSKYVFQNLLGNIKRADDLPNKLSRYQTASIVKYALLEVPTILALAAYFLTGNALHLVIALSLIAYFMAQRPTRKKILDELKLSFQEQKELE